VKAVKKLGVRLGNWLAAESARLIETLAENQNGNRIDRIAL
jgi:hypothetical protein